MKSLCPTCGHQVAPLELIVSRSTHEAMRLGRTVKLSAQQTIILHALVERPHGFVSVDEICVEVYGCRDGPEDEGQVIRSQMKNLRRKLAPLAAHIEGRRTIGYRLALDSLPTCTVAA